jgi:bacteriocin-like protein
MAVKKLTDEELAKISGGKCCADSHELIGGDGGGGGGGGGRDEVDRDAPGSEPSALQQT